LVFTFESTTGKYAYIQIPKNASSTLGRSFFPKNGCNSIPFSKRYRLEDRTFVVVLRDPIERWKIGAAEDFVMQDGNTWKGLSNFWNRLTQKLEVGAHTGTQVNFIDKCQEVYGAKTFQYFILDNTLDVHFETWMRRKGFQHFDYSYLHKHENITSNTAEKQQALEWIKEHYNDELDSKLRKFLARDIELYNFYNKLNASVDRDLNKIHTI
jgi:hypothetical protein